jgi:hypothetical protein
MQDNKYYSLLKIINYNVLQHPIFFFVKKKNNKLQLPIMENIIILFSKKQY